MSKEESKRSVSAKGYGVDDPFLSYVKGYRELDDAAGDAMRLSIEIDHIISSLYPHKIWDGFCVEHPDKEVKNALTHHFLQAHLRSNGQLYGDYHRFPNFLRGIAKHLLIERGAFYAIYWGQRNINGYRYVLPLRFRYLRTCTMRVKRKHGHIIKFYQKYSWIGQLLNQKKYGRDTNQKFREVEFDKSEVFYTRYPFGVESPAKASLKYVRKILNFWDFGYYQSKGAAHPKMHDISVERARFRTYKEENRKRELIRGKIRKVFNYLYEGKITQFYDAYQMVQFKKKLNDFRNYLLREFNEQVLEVVARKNRFKEIPKIFMKGIMTNHEIDSVHEKFKKREISLQQFIDFF